MFINKFNSQKSLQRNEFLFKYANIFNENVLETAHLPYLCAKFHAVKRSCQRFESGSPIMRQHPLDSAKEAVPLHERGSFGG